MSHRNLTGLYERLDCLEAAADHLQAARAHVMHWLTDDDASLNFGGPLGVTAAAPGPKV